MAQPAKGQEPSMEEILASIRRIIADEPTKISRNNNPRSDGFRNESPRMESRHNEGPPSEGLRSEGPSYESPRHESPARSIAQGEHAPAARGSALAQPLSRGAAPSSRMAPPPRPPIPAVRAAPAPAPDPATQLEEIDAMLAELHAGSRQPPPEPEEPASDILDLTEQLAAAESLPAAELAASDDLAQPPYEDEALTEAPEQPRPAHPHRAIGDQVRDVDREHERERDRDAIEHGLISAATTAAVDSAFNTLAQTVLVQNGRTLEDLVREMLRPMLKIWLDDNLPSMVERLVRAEIERVSRGRG